MNLIRYFQHMLGMAVMVCLFFALQTTPIATWAQQAPEAEQVSEVNSNASSGKSTQQNQAKQDPDLQGCCSYHQGICGSTNDGKILCCDGVISPTCDLPDAP